MLKSLFTAFALVLASAAAATPVDIETARSAATGHFTRLGVSHGSAIENHTTAAAGRETGFYLFSSPSGAWVAVAADDVNPPILAYSLHGGRGADPAQHRIALNFIKRIATATPDTDVRDSRAEGWPHLTDGDIPAGPRYWPPAGTTQTDGWLEENWHQNSPYNDDCPIDPVTSQRSVAGCPAVAMAMIIDYHRTTCRTRFDDSDDYYHNYASRQFWIDDDATTHDFPSFPSLNDTLDDVDLQFATSGPLDDTDRAALTFACGVAAHQVYSSSVSGTFGVSQALAAYHRFSVTGCELLDEGDTDLYERITDNVKHALPVHLAVVDEGQTIGHNVVVDGYSSDGHHHLNFGWGGSYNGWYLLPDEIPYNLTVIEGAIVDINPSGLIFRDGFWSGDATYWSSQAP